MLSFLARFFPTRHVLVMDPSTAARVTGFCPDKRELPLERTPFVRTLERLQEANQTAWRKMDAADDGPTPEARATRKALRTHIAGATEADLEQMVILYVSQHDPEHIDKSFEEILEDMRTHRNNCKRDPDPK